MMSNDFLYNRLGAERIDDRQVAEIIGIALGILADGKINQGEVEFLQKYLAARECVTRNPVVALLKQRVDDVLADGVVDNDEANSLMDTLVAFAGGDFEAGELTKASTLPCCDPAPTMSFEGARICFTGTFNFGQRNKCEDAVAALGAIPGSLTKGTRYLIIGAYATDSWAQSAYGRKIEKAVEWRSMGAPIGIVREKHWDEQMQLVRLF